MSNGIYSSILTSKITIFKNRTLSAIVVSSPGLVRGRRNKALRLLCFRRRWRSTVCEVCGLTFELSGYQKRAGRKFKSDAL